MDWSKASTFGDLVDLAAAAFGDKVAFRDPRRELSFRGFSEEIGRVTSALLSFGLRPGARVAILSQNRVEVPVLLGLCRAGFIPVPLNWRLPVEEVASLLHDCEPAAFFVEDRYLSLVAQLPATSALGLTIAIGDAEPGCCSYASFAAHPASVGKLSAAPDDPACIIYTSGTTSTPKGVILTHAGIVKNCRDCAREAIGFTADDVSLMVMPLFHVGGIWYYMFPSVFSGCTTILRDRFVPEDVIAAFSTEPVSNIHVVPTMLADLLNRPAFVQSASSLRLVVYAGSSMPSELLNRALSALSNCEFAQAYGSTEAGSITALTPQAHRLAVGDPAHRQLLRSCGKPLTETEVRIDRPSDAKDSDVVGEILVRGPKLMASYWRRPEATTERFEDGWFRTGDVGYFDQEGYLYIVDRKNDMVISGGENIFPFEVEEVLCSHPLVEEASVFGIADPRWVEKLVAAVVLRAGARLSESDIIEYARARLPGYKTPKIVHLVETLPKNPVGKVLRKSLREQFVDG
ncbi:AMP-binding protein [Paraburkholderia hospita]|uniref:class I adenylate-forming enzyme family protein n=1 Tax=Paraburkholderia hospita TaxID=169430 RepID=UPI003ECF418B